MLVALSLGPLILGSTAGLWAFLSLIPLILLYLIRPKPKQVAIPSLMFFFRTTGRSRLASFLRTITNDWVLLLQLLLLALLSLAFAQPHTMVQHDVTSENTVLVIDVSASSQTREGSSTRFANSISKAKTLLGLKNTVILAKDVPHVGLQDAGPEDTFTFLNALTPRETTSRIGEAIILAGEVLSGKEGRVVVLSDFINTAGMDPRTAAAVLRAKQITVDLISTSGTARRQNVGIVKVDPSLDETTLFIRNYDTEPRVVSIVFHETSKDLSIPALATETFTFPTPAGKTEVRLKPDDDFLVDNYVYLSAPEQPRTRVLLVTSNASIYLKTALKSAPNIVLTIAELPVVPKDVFDVYLLQNIDENSILPGTLEDILRKAQDGAAVIVHAQESSGDIGYKGLNPVGITGQSGTAPVNVRQPSGYTAGIDFGAVTKHFKAVINNDKATAVLYAGDEPALVVSTVERGRLVWYGLLEEGSEFKFSPDYPIFWSEFIKALNGLPDIKTMNRRTRDTLILEKEQDITTPVGSKLRQSSVLLERAGYYITETGIVGANLADEFESDVNPTVKTGTTAEQYELKPVSEDRKVPLETALLAIAIFICFFELAYINLRGDL